MHNPVTHIDRLGVVFVTTCAKDDRPNPAHLKALGIENILTPNEAAALVGTEGIAD